MPDGPPDDVLRFVFAKAFEGAVPRDDCPDSSELYEAIHGTLDPERRLLLIDHISMCPVCAEAWRVARFLGTDTP